MCPVEVRIRIIVGPLLSQHEWKLNGDQELTDSWYNNSVNRTLGNMHVSSGEIWDAFRILEEENRAKNQRFRYIGILIGKGGREV
jgi:hypothetical protein